MALRLQDFPAVPVPDVPGRGDIKCSIPEKLLAGGFRETPLICRGPVAQGCATMV